MMRLLALKPGHDGSVVYVANGRLAFSYEAEKDSGTRYAPLDVAGMLEALRHVAEVPDALVVSGWAVGSEVSGRPIGSGYLGLQEPSVTEAELLGHRTWLVTSSHERSHLMSAYAMSPFPQRQPCYALIWEGHIGAFYEIDEALTLRRIKQIMVGPGIRYAFAYGLADPTFSLGRGHVRLGDAGKQMALAAYAQSVKPSAQETAILDALFSKPFEPPQFLKSDFRDFAIYNSGVASEQSKRLARLVSDRIFDIFHRQIKPLVNDRRPLLIAGGCGLNCEWNRAWLDSGLFSDVFVPPCPNDTGSAIGSAADAQWHFTGHAKLEWTVYSGQPFVDDVGYEAVDGLGPFRRHTSRIDEIAAALHEGAVLAMVSGRTEIGPRALGNRSIVAAPFHRSTLQRINAIKRREFFRPVAPVCLEEDLDAHFDLSRPSPYMLYFSKARSAALQATTHVDGSSRVQSVSASQNPNLHRLLTAFKAKTGYGVLCNTSLNFHGAGFINRTSDLVAYAQQTGLDGFVMEGTLFLRDWQPTCK
nr:carbamoyltransferase C-terminal domain-containing protein [Cupriavidus taiwanensis]